MANGAPLPPTSTSSLSTHALATAKQQQAMAAGATQLQQRAAAAAQFLSAERKITTREIQTMLEKNDAALRGWNALHAQEPPKTLVKEHKDWVRRCLVLRQQVGARLEVLASLADKQIAIEDESSAKKEDAQDTATPLQPLPPTVAQAAAAAAKKAKAPPAAQSRQPVQNKAKPSPAASATTAAHSAAMSSESSSTTVQMPTLTAAPIPSPTSFPEPPMPNPVAAQVFGFPTAAGNDAFFGVGQNAAMSSAGYGDASLQSFAMPTGAGAFGGNAFGNPNAFMGQQPNFMMNPAAMNPMAMMNPQFLAMQMQQMQSQMPGMNMAGAMYNVNANAMFGGYGGGMDGNQLPADPFNASFGASAAAFPAQPQFNPLTGNFDAMGGMPPPAMLGQMSAFPMMPDPMGSMMMNGFGYGMGGMAPPPPQQQLQPVPPQQTQTSQQQQQPQSDPPGDFPETSLFDDAIASNLFDGFPEDTFL